MQINNLLLYDNSIIRILNIQDNRVLVIDCLKRNMPAWIDIPSPDKYKVCSESDLSDAAHINIPEYEGLNMKVKKLIHDRYTMIAGILPFVDNNNKRNEVIAYISDKMSISKQTIRHYLCLFLSFQSITVFAPRIIDPHKEISLDEINMRWALNKYFYTCHKNTLSTAYTMMLKEKYCNNGVLFDKYPSIHQFRYYYRKHRSMQTYYISRDGLKDYQRNNRPLIGDGVQAFAPAVGIGMLDATVCDIYLVNDAGSIIGRPILTACIDAYSSLCCGYSLSWEGGVYSLNELLLNVITDKTELCKKYGIDIKPEQWNCSDLPGVLVTDMGSEYKSETFAQIADIGVTIINLPSYRPELKGVVEKFFDLIQNYFKPYLKGKGIIEPDYQERGAHDYRKDACLTMKEFEKIVIHCIAYYNTSRIIDNFPYTDDMLLSRVKPYANTIWEYGINQPGANLIHTDKQSIVFALLPRTNGIFSRYGLKVNKLRYHRNSYTERYLNGGNAIVAYNPDDITHVWLFDTGRYIEFDLIESRFNGKSLSETTTMLYNKKAIVSIESPKNIQAQVDLANHIEIIAANATHCDIQIKSISQTRKYEKRKTHKNHIKGGDVND